MHPYQERAVQAILDNLFQALFMKPGLGKTRIVLEALFRLRSSSALIVAPLAVCNLTGPAENRKWGYPFSLCNLAQLFSAPAKSGDSPDARSRARFARSADRLNAEPLHQIYLINPESLHLLFGKRNEKRTAWIHGPWRDWQGRPDMLVVDELTGFKHATGERARTLKKFLGDFERRVGMTGTPAPNGEHDLHGQMLIIDRGEALDPRVTYFEREYFDQVGYSLSLIHI